MSAQDQLVIGVDFGTDSVRALLVNALTGEELASAVFLYPRWLDGRYCDTAQHRFRQHPADYCLGLTAVIKDCLRQAGTQAAASVVAISVDTTGSTPVAVNREGTPLALLPAFKDNPNAMFVLWKDHTAVQEAAEINAHARACGVDYLFHVGGIYSAEWYWAKLLHILRADEQVRKACYAWVEHCDWIPFLLTGGSDALAMQRSRCAAGHKALWSEEFGGYPPDEFFSTLDPLLAGYAAWLPRETYTADQAAGTLCPEWATKLGLSTRVVIGTGAFDAHMGAVGGQIEPFYLSRIMGTSTCDILVADAVSTNGHLVQGICGQVDGSVIPGMTGFEAGQSAFGDAYAWFANLISWPLEKLVAESRLLEPAVASLLVKETKEQLLHELGRAAAQLPLQDEDELALDWLNGRRTPDANQRLTATISRLNLGSDAPRLFRAIAEATCFGARSIIECFQEQGIPVMGLIGIGGVAHKSPYIMQLLADSCGLELRISASEQTCALGAAMFAAVCAGIYPDIRQAMQAMGAGFDRTYQPDPRKKAFYDRRYRKYQRLGYFTEEELHELS